VSDLSKTPDYILRYMAPMNGPGKPYREEIMRRIEHDIQQLARQLFADDCRQRGAMMIGGFGFMSDADKQPWLERASKIVFERDRRLSHSHEKG
jgi:hypothetical protein